VYICYSCFHINPYLRRTKLSNNRLTSTTNFFGWFLILPLAILICLYSCKGSMKTSQNKISVAIQFTYTSSYCGGAEPPQELLNTLATPQPFTGEKIYIKKGKINKPDDPIEAESIINENGLVKLNLPPGEYYVVFENKVDRATYEEFVKNYGTGSAYYEPIDIKCLDTWLSTPELTFTAIASSENSYSVNSHKNCPWNSVPCAGYIGSLPP